MNHLAVVVRAHEARSGIASAARGRVLPTGGIGVFRSGKSSLGPTRGILLEVKLTVPAHRHIRRPHREALGRPRLTDIVAAEGKKLHDDPDAVIV